MNRNRQPGCVRVLVWLLASLGGLGTASAFECKRSDGPTRASLTWAERTIEFGVLAGPDEPMETVAAALRAWTTVGCTDLRFIERGFVDEASAPPATLSFIDAGWVDGSRPESAVALTTTTYNRFTGAILEGRIEVNRDGFRFDGPDACHPAGRPYFDLQAVLTHEVGHLVGLDHTQVLFGDERDPTMAPSVGVCEQDMRSLEDDDEDAICTLYPQGRPNGSCDVFSNTPGFVSNRTFGCRSSPSRPSWDWGLTALVVFLGLSERRVRRSCSRPRSAR